MILSEKLLALRTKAGLSQEELAERLDVSRQSVSKWESANSIPGIDKIIELARLYDVSTDYLLIDDMEELPREVIADGYQPEAVREISLETATEYLSEVYKAAKNIALGVGLCIFSSAPLLGFIGMSDLGKIFATEDVAAGVGAGVLLFVVAIAVIIFVISGMRLGEYKYLEEEKICLSYGVQGIVEKEAKESLHSRHIGIAYGVAVCIVACVPIVIAGAMDASDGVIECLCALMMVIISIGVYIIVRVSIRKGGYDRLLQQGDYTEEKKAENKQMELFDGVYWGSITAIYLTVSFVFALWGRSWQIWPVAGVIYAVVRPIVAGSKKGR